MPPLRRAATGLGSGGGDLTAIGNNELAAGAGGFYFVDELLGTSPIQNLSSGGAGYYGLPTPGGVPSLPAGWTAAQIAGHPGLVLVQTAALNDVGGFALCNSGAPMNQNVASPTLNWNCIFGMPQLSTATDRYQLIFGPLIPSAAGGPQNGWGVSYSDSIASGNWQLIEYQNSTMGPVTIATVSSFPTANTWYRVNITVKGIVVTLSIQQFGTNQQIYSASGNSTILNNSANSVMSFCPLGAWCKRTTFVSGTIIPLWDRVSINESGIGRS